MGETLMQRVTRRVDDVGRRVEIRFPDFEMDDVAPLSLERPRLNQNFESGLGSETRHALCEAEFPGLSHDGEISIINSTRATCLFVRRRDCEACVVPEFAADAATTTLWSFETSLAFRHFRSPSSFARRWVGVAD
jgi:hypothetical protein